ncbi:MAG: DNA ligase [Pseudonocardiaceae bacterium]|nr:DNA ligase [Pseudonocardiaceae bacterium]
MLATTGQVPSGSGWAFEFKWDGVRAVTYRRSGSVQLLSRNDNDVTLSYPELLGIDDLLGEHDAVLDGEVVALDRAGRPNFGQLQHRMHERSPSEELRRDVPVTYYVFDVLVLNGKSVLDEPFEHRRELLEELDLDDITRRVRVPPCYPDVDGQQMLDVARSHGLEGVLAKRLDSRYTPGRRSTSWIKTALVDTQEVVICGWKRGQGRRAGTIGSLLLGAYDSGGALRYIGHVGTGFTDSMLDDLFDRLGSLARNDNPFDTGAVPREYARDAQWVEPVLVGEVEYRTLTSDNRLRHASWRGLRADKSAGDVEAP